MGHKDERLPHGKRNFGVTHWFRPFKRHQLRPTTSAYTPNGNNQKRNKSPRNRIDDSEGFSQGFQLRQFRLTSMLDYQS